MAFSNLADHRPRSLGRPPALLAEDVASLVLAIDTPEAPRKPVLRFQAGAPAPAGRTLDRRRFLRDRLRSYPPRQLREHGSGLSLLGGPARALGFAWSGITRSLASKPLDLDVRSHGSEGTLLPWAAGLARDQGIEVEPDSLDEMDAFLLQTRSRSVIYLKKKLGPHRQAFCICHELAHHVLGHRSNSSYGLDPQWLGPEELVLFERQEATADALASLWLHLFTGLTDIGRKLTEPLECCRKRSTSQARESSLF